MKTLDRQKMDTKPPSACSQGRVDVLSVLIRQRQNVKEAKKGFRVARSFAGEEREFVAQVAANLASIIGEEAILYDEYHEAAFARHRLGFDSGLYHNVPISSHLSIVPTIEPRKGAVSMASPKRAPGRRQEGCVDG